MVEQGHKAKSFPLRLSRTLHEEARTSAAEEGISLNHFIEIAVAEKVTRMEIETRTPADPAGRGL